MKRQIAIIAALCVFYTSYSQGVQLYLGIRGGVGGIMTKDNLNNVPTSEGSMNVSKENGGWSTNAKGEVLLGLGRFRIGYQFLYNFSAPTIATVNYTPVIDNSRYTTYYNGSQGHFYGHYLLVELAIINTRHFALTPGVAIGSYTGYKVDNTTNGHVSLAEVTHNRFSIGAELNAELKFGRCVFFAGPNYYLFSLQDKAQTDWHEYQHFLGADLGFRFNLLKPVIK